MNRLLTFILLSLTPVISFGQESPQLVDQMTSYNCEIGLVTADMLGMRLLDKETALGAIVISGPPESPLKKLLLELNIRSAMKQRRVDISRLLFIRGADTADITMKTWLLSSASDSIPGSGINSWDLKLPLDFKPFVIQDYEDQICDSASRAEVVLELFKANPTIRINVVVFGKSARVRSGLLKTTKVKFSDIPKNTVRYFHQKTNGFLSNPLIEYWLLPSRK